MRMARGALSDIQLTATIDSEQPVEAVRQAPLRPPAAISGGATGRTIEPAAQYVAPQDVATLARRAARGSMWILVAFAAARALSFLTSLVLARLLTPSDFGLMSFAVATIGAFMLVQDLGAPAAMIYGERDVRAVGGTALVINVGAALSMLAVLTAMAPFLEGWTGQGGIGPVLTLLAIGLVLASLGSVQSATLVRELAMRRKAVSDIVSMAMSGLVSVTMALTGFGIWSLVGGYLTRTGTSSFVLWLVSPVRLRPEFNWPIARELLTYGRHISFAGILGFVAANLDYLIVGVALGSHDLGIYALAFTIANVPANAVNETLSQVTFSAYARLRDRPGELGPAFLQVLRLVCLSAIPIGLCTWILAPLLPGVLLGPRWQEIVGTLQVLAWYGVLRSIGYAFPPVFKAVGRPDVVWKLNLVRLLILTSLMLGAIHFEYGIVGIAAVHVGVALVFVPIGALWSGIVLRIGPARFVRLAVPFAAALATSALTAAALSATLLSGAGLSGPVASGPDENLVALLGDHVALAGLACGLYAVIVGMCNPRGVRWGWHWLRSQCARRRTGEG
jgi:O-antigen/teichoic acid export membrane protein